MLSSSRKSLVVGAVVAVALVASAVFALSSPRFLNKPVHTFDVKFPTADGLVGGSDVFEAGAKIGSISSITANDDDTATVTVQITDDHWPLHDSGSKPITAEIRPKSLLGEKYVAIHDGDQSSVYNGHLVVADKNSTPVELDQFVNSLDPNTRAATRVLLSDLGAGLAGRGQDLNTAIADAKLDLQHLNTTGATLANRDPELDRILVSLDGALGAITTNDQLTQLSQLIDNSQNVLNQLESERVVLGRQFIDTEAALSNINTVLEGRVGDLRTVLSTAPGLLSALGTESQLLAHSAGDLVNGVDPKGTTYLADLAESIRSGPTTLGGALDDKGNPITRICFLVPPTSVDPTAGNKSCTGNGFTGAPGPQPLPASPAATDRSGGNGASALAQFMEP